MDISDIRSVIPCQVKELDQLQVLGFFELVNLLDVDIRVVYKAKNNFRELRPILIYDLPILLLGPRTFVVLHPIFLDTL
jgi:hypothetical protein